MDLRFFMLVESTKVLGWLSLVLVQHHVHCIHRGTASGGRFFVYSIVEVGLVMATVRLQDGGVRLGSLWPLGAK